MTKTYTISISLDSDPIAESESEALEQAREMIEQGFYSLQVVDTESSQPYSEVEHIKNYLIDCVGYSADDLEGLNKFELYDLVTDIKEMNEYISERKQYHDK